jgi:hypothetical protein
MEQEIKLLKKYNIALKNAYTMEREEKKKLKIEALKWKGKYESLKNDLKKIKKVFREKKKIRVMKKKTKKKMKKTKKIEEIQKNTKKKMKNTQKREELQKKTKKKMKMKK